MFLACLWSGYNVWLPSVLLCCAEHIKLLHSSGRRTSSVKTNYLSLHLHRPPHDLFWITRTVQVLHLDMILLFAFLSVAGRFDLRNSDLYKMRKAVFIGQIVLKRQRKNMKYMLFTYRPRNTMYYSHKHRKCHISHHLYDMAGRIDSLIYTLLKLHYLFGNRCPVHNKCLVQNTI